MDRKLALPSLDVANSTILNRSPSVKSRIRPPPVESGTAVLPNLPPPRRTPKRRPRNYARFDSKEHLSTKKPSTCKRAEGLLKRVILPVLARAQAALGDAADRLLAVTDPALSPGWSGVWKGLPLYQKSRDDARKRLPKEDRQSVTGW